MGKNLSAHYKYNQLIGELREKIFSGEFRQGEKLPSERKLSELFGFARITIRTALRELKEDSLIEQRRGSGTYVAVRKKKRTSSRPKRKYRFCFLCNPGNMGIAPEDDPYNSRILLGIRKAAAKDSAFDLEILSNPEKELPLETYLKQRNEDLSAWDGFFIAGAHTEKDLVYLSGHHANFVAFGETLSERFFPVVTSDNFKGGTLLADYLIGNGRKKAVVLFYDHGCLWEQRRCAGLCSAFADAGLEKPVFLFGKEDPLTIEETQKLISPLLKKRPFPFDALIVQRDMQAIGLMEALEKAQIAVPEEIAVASFDAYSYLENMYPDLPAVAQPFAEMGEAAAQTLLSMLRDKECPVTVKILQPKFNKMIHTRGNFKSP